MAQEPVYPNVTVMIAMETPEGQMSFTEHLDMGGGNPVFYGFETERAVARVAQRARLAIEAVHGRKPTGQGKAVE